MILKADTYIEEKSLKINDRYRHSYHAMPPVGWMNDPNGFSFYQGEYHLFYQYYPYASHWGPMHWGHMKSKDLIVWENLPVALAPDEEYDQNGCFSGTAIAWKDKHVIMYTGNLLGETGKEEDNRQVQCIAIGDGNNYEKLKINPVIGRRMIPDGNSKVHFRDPKIWWNKDKFYSLIGNMDKNENGQLLMYKSSDLKEWEFVNRIETVNKYGKMWECPDYFKIQKDDVLIVSPQFLKQQGDRFYNIHSSIYMTGQMEEEKGIFREMVVDEIDYGLDFYAPQTLLDSKGRRIMIAWMQMWDRTYVTHELEHYWVGAMTLPRELSLIEGQLVQKPIEELKNYRTDEYHSHFFLDGIYKEDGISGDCLEMEVTFSEIQATTFGIKLFVSEEDGQEETVVTYDMATCKLKFDRSKSGNKISGNTKEEGVDNIRHTKVLLVDGQLKLHIFLDYSSIELFINDGVRTMTSNVYPQQSSKGIRFFSDGKIGVVVKKWNFDRRNYCE